jgi:hypothetical protein
MTGGVGRIREGRVGLLLVREVYSQGYKEYQHSKDKKN